MPTPAFPRADRVTILLAEDHDTVRRLYSFGLTLVSFIVLEVANTEEALDAARRQSGPIELLVADVCLSEAGTRELEAHLRPAGQLFKVLNESGFPFEDLVRYGKEEHGEHFLQKPFTPGALAGKVHELLDG